jgi:hypothetical protein
MAKQILTREHPPSRILKPKLPETGDGSTVEAEGMLRHDLDAMTGDIQRKPESRASDGFSSFNASLFQAEGCNRHPVNTFRKGLTSSLVSFQIVYSQ